MENNFTYIYKRPSIVRKERGHTNVLRNKILIGYLIQERGKFVVEGQSWFFVGNDKVNGANFPASNRKKLVAMIEERFSIK